MVRGNVGPGNRRALTARPRRPILFQFRNNKLLDCEARLPNDSHIIRGRAMTIRQMLRKLKKDRALIDQAIAALQTLEDGRRGKRVSPRTHPRPKLVVQEKKNGTDVLVIPFSSTL
jgi:hypothetical protein